MPASTSTVHGFFEATAIASPGAAFLCTERTTACAYGVPAGELSYAEALAAVQELRARYAAAGYGHGHRVGLLLENRPAFFLHWFALNALGASVVPIHADLRAAEIAYLIGHSELCLAVTLPARHEDLRRGAAEAGCRIGLVAPDGLDALPGAGVAAPRAGESVDSGSEAALLYTSGTTGRPKGCVLANDYYTLAGQWYAGIGGMAALRPGVERLITPLPLTHMNAMAYSAMAMVATGGCLVQLDRFHPRHWWESVRESGATVVHYLGVMPAMLLSAPPSPGDRDHAVRFGFGAGVDRAQHAIFEQRFGFPLLEAWAMTETGAGAVVIANREPRHVGRSCFGRPEPAVEIRLAAEDGSEAVPGQPGELLVRAAGPQPRRGFFRRYLKDSEATDEAWAGGWFHTGDIVCRDADGTLRFVDRRKNVIRRSGENISAVEVESVLAQHPAVKAVAVAATPDAVRGDEVLACVVAHDMPAPADRAALAEAIVGFALARLAYYKVPGFVAFVDVLPLTPSQKVQRGELRALAADLPGTPGCVDTRLLKKRQELPA